MFGRIANILGWAGVALVLAGVVTWLVRGDLVTLRQAFAIGGLVCILIYAASQWREMAATLSKRQARYGALSAVSVLVVLGILVGLNYFADKYSKRWDLSASREFTLSDQTRKVVAGLKGPLRILVFDRPSRMQPYRDRLAEYAHLSTNIKPEYLDIDRDKAVADEYQVTGPTVLVEYQKRVERVTSGTSEQEITNAIVKAVQGQQQKVYFTSGHGEKNPGSPDERIGYNAANSALQRDNFTVETLVIAQRGEIPADASVVIVAGPTHDFLESEIGVLRQYLDRGGKLLMLLDPQTATDASPLTNLTAVAAEWGMDLGGLVVVDANNLGQAVAPVVVSYPAHPITERFPYMTFFPLARPVTTKTEGARIAQPLLESSEQSWGESDIQGLRDRKSPVFDPAADKRGPVALGAAIAAPAPAAPPAPAPAAGNNPADAPKPETRVVVIGDSDFPTNGALGFQGNRDFFLNVVNWLAKQENLISIRPKAPDDRRVTMTDGAVRLVRWLSLVLVPGAIFAAGVYTWWRRRG